MQPPPGSLANLLRALNDAVHALRDGSFAPRRNVEQSALETRMRT